MQDVPIERYMALLHNKLWASCIMCMAISMVWAPEVRTLADVFAKSVHDVRRLAHSDLVWNLRRCNLHAKG